MRNLRCLITAGPTREYFDAVRFLSNPSTGKMGYAIAAAAVKLGWQVRLISGPVQLEIPEGLTCSQVISTEQMHQACKKYFPQSDICIMAAAPCDVRPKHFQSFKVRKSDIELSPELLRTSDILAELGRLKKPEQYLVGFAAECDAPAETPAKTSAAPANKSSAETPAESPASVSANAAPENSATINAAAETPAESPASVSANAAPENSATINAAAESPASVSANAAAETPAESPASVSANAAPENSATINANAESPANAAPAETSIEAPAGKTYLSESALLSAQKKCVAKNLDLIAANCIEAPALGSEQVCQQPSNPASPAGNNNAAPAKPSNPASSAGNNNAAPAEPSNSASPAGDDGNDGFTKQANAAELSDFAKRPNAPSPSDASGAAVLPSSGFAAETNTLVLLGGQNEAPVQLGPAPKAILAEQLLEYIGKKLPNAS